MMIMSHSVRIKTPFSHHQDNQALAHMKTWCTNHVGVIGDAWSCEIVHMDYDLKQYTILFHFDDLAHAATFALLYA